MNKIFTLICLFVITLTSAQKKTKVVLETPWIIGAGLNIVDNDGFQFEKAFNTDNWNFKNPIMLSGEYRIKTYLAANLTLSLNSLEANNLQNGFMLPTNYTLFAADANAKLYFDQFYLPTYKLNRLETYILTGVGFTSVRNFNTGTFNAGLGFQIWISNDRDIGIRLQTVGKWGFTDWIYLKNYMQHSAELIYRF